MRIGSRFAFLLAVHGCRLMVAAVTLSLAAATLSTTEARANDPVAVVSGKRAKQRCPAGTAPVVRKRGKRAVARRDRRGRLRCRAIPLPRPPAPAATPLGQAADVAGVLRQAVAVDPSALDRLAKAVGRRRAKRLLAITLDGWAARAGAARAAQAPQAPRRSRPATASPATR